MKKETKIETKPLLISMNISLLNIGSAEFNPTFSGRLCPSFNIIQIATTRYLYVFVPCF